MANTTGYGYLLGPAPQFFDANGKPLVGGKLFVYIAGTTTTAVTYSDFNRTENTSPVILNYIGSCILIVPSANLYKIVLYDRKGNLLLTRDNVRVSIEYQIIYTNANKVESSDSTVDVTETTDTDTGIITYDLSIKGEIDRATEAEKGLADAIETEKNRAEEAERTLSESISEKAGTASPLMDGKASVGNSLKYAREDHVHPTDTSRASASHTHGNIANGGTLQTNDITIANGDKLVVTDASDSGKVARTSISFDGSTATKALTQKGTWETFNNYSHPAGSAASKTGVPAGDVSPAFGGTFKVNQISTDSTSHVSAITERTITIPNATATTSDDGLMSAADKTKLDGIAAGTASPLMDGKASVGNSLKYAREDHVHPTDTSREDKANKTTVVLGTSNSKYPTDKAVAEFVNSSIATNTANYISNNGEPFTSVEQLNAYSGTVTNNDYAFVTGIDSEGNTYYDRYKATVSGETVTWALEYRLNNSSFTAAQWSAINSGITSALVAKIHDHSNKDVLDGITSDKVNSWDGKEDAFDVLPTTKGGTGTNAASKSALTSALINSLSEATATPNDADYYVSQYVGGGTTNTSYRRRPLSSLWEYIKYKISRVLGLTSSSYSGKAATAGTADKAVADKSGNDIETTYATKSELSTHTRDTTVHITAEERKAWNAKQSKLTFDVEPTAGSNNPVTSNGIKTAIDTIDAKGITIKEISGEQVICFE